jgi:MSHA pilin protein MshA
MNNRHPLKNQKGFTLVEIIAVLILIGILAAVAVPRFINLSDQARQSAAQAAIAEVKSRLSSGYGMELLQNAGATPTLANILSEAGLTTATTITIGDFVVTPSITGTTGVLISVSSVQGQTLGTAQVGTWTMP